MIYSNNGKYLPKNKIPHGIDFSEETNSNIIDIDLTKSINIIAIILISVSILMSIVILYQLPIYTSAENTNNSIINSVTNIVTVLSEPKPSHIHEYKYEVVNPTCFSNGYTIRTCECGIEQKFAYIPKISHTYGEWIQDSNPSYWNEGSKFRKCACGHTEKEVIPKLDYPNLNYDNPSPSTSDRFFGYSEEDFMYLLRTLVGECHGCPEEDQLATGSVILNRLNNKKFWNYKNIKDVVYRPDQYSCWGTSLVNREPTQLNIDVALKLLKDGPTIPENCIFQAGFPQGDGIYKVYSSGIMICYKD